VVLPLDRPLIFAPSPRPVVVVAVSPTLIQTGVIAIVFIVSAPAPPAIIIVITASSPSAISIVVVVVSSAAASVAVVVIVARSPGPIFVIHRQAEFAA
jgi:hypothetical protein